MATHLARIGSPCREPRPTDPELAESLLDYKWQAPCIPRENYLFDFCPILHHAGTNMAVQNEMLRHFDLQNTINAYRQAFWANIPHTVRGVAKLFLTT